MSYQRIDRLLANICRISRADATKAIRRGRVTLNGQPIKSPDTKADTEQDTLTLDGRQLNISEYVYIMLNKPEGVVCSTDGKELSVFDLLPDEMRRRQMFTVGRLDKDTTGLVIITDDGKFVHNAANPKRNVGKSYIVTLANPLSAEAKAQWEAGLTLADGDMTAPAQVKTLTQDGLTVEITIHEGKYHQIKRMAGAVGNRVVALKRTAIGEILLDKSLLLGECRYLCENEVKVYN